MGVEIESRKMEAVSSYLMQRLARPDFVLCYYCVHIQKHTQIIEKSTDESTASTHFSNCVF